MYVYIESLLRGQPRDAVEVLAPSNAFFFSLLYQILAAHVQQAAVNRMDQSIALGIHDCGVHYAFSA